jgi:tetratricopeptide (TPR) repeat protein
MRSSILGLTILVAAASPALANDKAKAKALYEQGLKHYNLAEYPEAIKAWKEAYSLSRRPLLLFNIGQAYRLAGDCKLASTFYDNYQREEPNPKNQDELDSALALCAKPVDKPIDKPVDKPADKPVDKPANVIDKQPPEAAGDTPDPKLGPVPGDGHGPVDADAAESRGGGLRKAGIGVAAAGLVMSGAGIYFALDSRNAANEVGGHMGEWGQPQMDIEARGERSATLAWVMGGLGIAAIAAGGVMIAIGGPKATESQMAVVPTRGGVAFGYGFRF